MFGGIARQLAASHRVLLMDFLGYGRSARLERFPTDLWYDEALQAIALLRELRIESADLIGCSGGALVAINAALEAPSLIGRVIADSFEGERAQTAFTEHLAADREQSKGNPGAIMFYRAMQGEDWASVVDADTDAVVRHSRELGAFFHRPLGELKADILLTGSLEDEFMSAPGPDFLAKTYGDLLEKAGHGSMHLFPHGGHPAMLSNGEEFAALAEGFLRADPD